MRILIIEDDEHIASQLAQLLKAANYVPHLVHDGEDGHFEGEEGNYEAILLDIGLPQMDGFTILEKWRAAGITTPVIILTARDNKSEVVRGLEAGADDYITKPFDFDEVIARINSNIRRHLGKHERIFRYKNVSLDTKNNRITVGKDFVTLTRTEYRILHYLFMHQGRPVSINEIIEHTYEDFDNDSSIIPRHIANIRKKIGSNIIQTEANRGYYVPLEDRA